MTQLVLLCFSTSFSPCFYIFFPLFVHIFSLRLTYFSHISLFISSSFTYLWRCSSLGVAMTSDGVAWIGAFSRPIWGVTWDSGEVYLCSLGVHLVLIQNRLRSFRIIRHHLVSCSNFQHLWSSFSNIRLHSVYGFFWYLLVSSCFSCFTWLSGILDHH